MQVLPCHHTSPAVVSRCISLYLVVSRCISLYLVVSRCLVVQLYLVMTHYIVVYRFLVVSRCILRFRVQSAAGRRARRFMSRSLFRQAASCMLPSYMLILPCKCFHATTHLLPLYLVVSGRAVSRCLVVQLYLYLVFSLCLVVSRAFVLCSDRGSEPLRSSWAYHRQYHGRGSWVAHFPDP